jgi:Fe-S cluster assembly ATP-binding protein
VFLAFQYPVEIPGVNNTYFLRRRSTPCASTAAGEPELDAFDFLQAGRAKSEARCNEMDESFLKRGVNVGFSGGEKKRNEILQMAVLEPKLARSSTRPTRASTSTRCASSPTGVNALRSPRARRGVVLVTHYQRLLDYIVPDACTCWRDGAHRRCAGAGAAAGHAGSSAGAGVRGHRRRDLE